ncbi:hypothetical protein C8Q72DRAFT_832557 [Fomitopsis betulina]|nr:hypothetical protein C8Q72DRAFT_832557 [Fomitopsis betulina]
MVSLSRPPDGLFDVVKNAIVHHADERQTDKEEHPSTPPLAQPPVENNKPFNHSHDQQSQDERPWGDDNREGTGESAPPDKPPDKHTDSDGPHPGPNEQPSLPASPKSKTSFHPSSAKSPSDDSKRGPRRGLSISTTRGHISQPGTPQQRTGPPRSISYNYSISSAHGHTLSPTTSRQQEDNSTVEEDPDRSYDFPTSVTSPFRGALEYGDRELREREREIAERKHRRKDSYFHNPMKWLTESPRDTPKDEEPPFSFTRTRTEGGHQDSEEGEAVAGPSQATSPQTPAGTPRLRYSRSMPHIDREGRSPAAPKWGRLRSLLPHIASQAKTQTPAPSTVVSPNVNITDELITGGLATQMLRMWFERDDKGHRRVPALFHRLRIRVSDSLHPLHGNKAVFRIECEYANGAGQRRWLGCLVRRTRRRVPWTCRVFSDSQYILFAG